MSKSILQKKRLSIIKIVFAIAISFTFYLLPFTLRAQGSAFVATHQHRAILPGDVKNVSFVDGDMYCYSLGVMLKVQRSGEQLLGFWTDTTYARLEENVEYVVRHPSGDLYFTSRDKKGRSFLYRCSGFGTKEEKVEQVKLDGGLFDKGMIVEHPTFSNDGTIVIFSSKGQKRSMGGYDLWFSHFDGKQWTKPQNMGYRVNTRGDETAPSVSRDCLLFSSNGHSADKGKMSLYSARLFSEQSVFDSMGILAVDRCRVQRLPEPLNTDYADDFDMAIDTATGYGYWVSYRKTFNTNSQFFSFSGTLDGVLLWGTVSDKYGNPLSDVTVIARQGNDVVCNTTTDADGHYRLYLICNQDYRLSYKLDNYFVSFESVNTAKNNEESIISESRRDVVLDRLPLGQRIYFEDLFGPDVDVELSARGRELLAPLVQFLNDNPALKVSMKLVNDLTDNRDFNVMLTDERIQSLENYLYLLLPSTAKIDIENGCIGRDGCGNASGLSRLTVLIDK